MYSGHKHHAFQAQTLRIPDVNTRKRVTEHVKPTQDQEMYTASPHPVTQTKDRQKDRQTDRQMTDSVPQPPTQRLTQHVFGLTICMFLAS